MILLQLFKPARCMILMSLAIRVITRPDVECMHQRIKELLKTAIQSIEGERAEEAIQVLEKIERIIEVSHILNKYMAKLNKPFDKKLKVLCYYNLACIYQQY